jgi:hypothetical protein
MRDHRLEGGREGRTYPCGSTASAQLLDGDGIGHVIHPRASKFLRHRHPHEPHLPNGLDLNGAREGGRVEMS